MTANGMLLQLKEGRGRRQVLVEGIHLLHGGDWSGVKDALDLTVFLETPAAIAMGGRVIHTPLSIFHW